MIYDFLRNFHSKKNVPISPGRNQKQAQKQLAAKNSQTCRPSAPLLTRLHWFAKRQKIQKRRSQERRFLLIHIRKATALSWRSKRSHRLSAVPLVMLRITAFRGAVMGGVALGNPLPHQISTKRKFHRSFRQKSQKHPQILRNAGVLWCRQPESNRHGFNTGGF